MIDLFKNRLLSLAAVFLLGAVAGAGVIPLIPLGNDEPPASEPPPAPTTSSSPTTVVEVEKSSLPELPGVDAAISDVLAESGFASLMGRKALQAQLDPAIVQVLEESDAVVTVVEDQTGEETP